MLQIESKFLFVYVLLAGKRTENISYVKNSLLLYMQIKEPMLRNSQQNF